VLDAQRDPQPLSIEDVAAEVISSVHEQELEVRDRAGHWHMCRVRPYLTLEGGVDGAVVVLIDIHAVRHALENTLNIVRANREPLLVLDRDLRVRIASDAFYEHYRVTRPETEGRLLYELGNGQWDIQSLRHLLEDVLPKNTRIEDYEVEHEFDLLGRRIISLHARRFEHPGETLPTILLTLQDVTERRRAEREVRRSHDELMAHADELTRFNTAAVGRELRMIELKREVNDLCRRLGEHPRYDPRLTEGA
jgi:two-component system CheB/CheR fusion protein